ncbi:hypothetical protein FCL47_02380 [Desulfopila sp. IMCC35006]|uniref:hypothetical protein n=1 Tax=Desulfopila sp. IMCC35006 TaxID=2569542 RepID=UPI0010AC7B1B|nr:hypothetical protein [Desulfopila sp. IMCC35006]TKB28358.1 hypothetical protein FCL47_02380 [Desulfopila sp. IMCC35006]
MRKTILKQKALRSSLGIFIAFLLLLFPAVRIPLLDAKTDTYFTEAITRAGIAYATCRAINASVSIIKDSQLQLEPAGIGVSLAVGQVLDPIDDMTERLSTVLVTAITSLGVQKLSYEIGVSLAPRVLAGLLLVLSLLVWFDNDRLSGLQHITVRLMILLAVLRLCLPLSSIVNHSLYTGYFAEEIARASQQLDLRSEASGQFSDIATPDTQGFWATIGNSTAVIKKISADLKKSLETFVTNATEIIENLLKLTFLYVAIFLIQVIVLPVSIFWFLVYIASSLLKPVQARDAG